MHSGLAGIGYALLYVIRGDLLEADFEDLFGKQVQVVKEQTCRALDEPRYNGFDQLNTVLFWNMLGHPDALYIRNCLLDAAGKRLMRLFENLQVNFTGNLLMKGGILSRWTQYMRLVSACRTYEPPVALFERYMNLYRKDCFRNEWETGHWLDVLSGRVVLPGLPEVAARNREVGNWEGMREEQSFSTYIRCLYLQLHDAACRQIALERVRADYLEAPQEELETRLGRLEVLQSGTVGLHGIARLLLLLCAVCRLEDPLPGNRIDLILGSL